MTTSRHYNDPCGIARALDLVGERWALLVVRELMHGPKRFADLRAGLPTISPNVLSQRLGDLTERGIVRKSRLEPPVTTDVYQLTELGEQLEPVLLALAHWGSRAAAPTRGELSADAFVLALRTTAVAERRCPPGDYVVDLGTDRFTFRIGDGHLTSRRGAAKDPIARISGTIAAIRAVVFGDDTFEDRDLYITGNRRAARAFMGLFERPTVLP